MECYIEQYKATLPNNKRKTANKTSNSVSTNQSAGNPKTFLIDKKKFTRMHNKTRRSSALLISFLSIFSCTSTLLN